MGITRAEALDCLQSHDLIGIGMEADAVRRRLHPDGVVTYAIGMPIDVSGALGGGAKIDASILQVRNGVNAGAAGVQIRGCSSASHAAVLLEVVRALRTNFPELWLEVPASELLALAASDILLSDLHEAGLDGVGADDPTLESADPVRFTEIIALHRAAHNCNMPSVASVRFGVSTTLDQHLDQLVKLYELQAETRGFQALAVVPQAPANRRELDGVTALERLRMLATARMFLDNIPHVQAMPSPHGLKVLQTSLRFGANDLGWVLPVAGASDAPQDAPEEDMRRIIRDADFVPAQRDARYTAMIAV